MHPHGPGTFPGRPPKASRPHGHLVLAAALALAGCGEKANPQAAPEVIVAPVIEKEVPITTEWVGTLKGYVNAEIRPKVSGYILSQAYKEGSLVREGDLLFQIDPKQFQAALDQAQGGLAQAQAVLGKTEIDVKRYRPLVPVGAVSRQELDNAVQANLAARAQVESARAAQEQARFNLEWSRVVSPIDGIAGLAQAQVGDLVGPSGPDPLTTVSKLDPIKVSFNISEQEYLRYAERINEEQGGEKGGLELILADGSVYPHRGTAIFANRQVDVTTGTITIEGAFPNPGNLLRPGQFARVVAVTRRLAGALVIPQRAVRDLQSLTQVAVVGPGDKVTFRSVELGPAIGTDYVVTAGLRAGDRVVVEGLQRIRDGMPVKPRPAPRSAPAPARAGK